MTPERAILTLPLLEGQKTSFSFENLTDIYGRTSDYQYTVEPKQEPFVDLRLADNRQYYRPDESIKAKLYALKAPKRSYSIKLCHLSLETYARAERILTSDMTGSQSDALYDIMSGSGSSGCNKKDIDLTNTGYVSNFSLQDIALGGKLTPGMYIVGLTQKSDATSFRNLVMPILFTVMDTHITMKVDASGKMLFLVTDISTGAPLPDQDITVMRNITRTYTEKWDSVK